jgi:hypothetical protein
VTTAAVAVGDIAALSPARKLSHLVDDDAHFSFFCSFSPTAAAGEEEEEASHPVVDDEAGGTDWRKEANGLGW